MRFRPCIDIHDGLVKQLVGGSLSENGKDLPVQNFVSEKDAAWYAALYRKEGLRGGHIALLNAAGTEAYEKDRLQAKKALAAFPEGLQLGGGVTAENAAEYLDMGASHVIVTSYIFTDGEPNLSRLTSLKREAGREHVVIDLSCRKKDGHYFVVTKRWQEFTKEQVSRALFDGLAPYCDEFLVHGVDVEGKKGGLDEELVTLLASFPYTITYAGGIASLADIERLKRAGKGRLDFTVGSALSLFGGSLSFEEVCHEYNHAG